MTGLDLDVSGPAPAVGIDLGTTNSAVAVVDVHGRPVVLPNRLGEPITPSVVCFGHGRVLVGREAKELQAAGDPGAAAFFKRQMGVQSFVFHAEGRDHTAVDLSAHVLAALRRDAERALGREVRRAVISVPAYFRNPQREATRAAGRQAGLEVVQMINEPTAAAVAYGFAHGAGERRTLLVYDLGGGTFDVTLLELGGHELRIRTSDGDHELGGKDWDDRIVELLASRFAAEFGADPLDDRESCGDLLVRAEEAKKRLSTAERATITLIHGGRRGRYELDRATFERLTADLMERTIALTVKVLADQRLTPRDVDGVLLAGGSTRMPMVHEFVRRVFGRPPASGVNVDEAVALGAALVAAQAGDPSPAAQKTDPTFALAGAPRTLDVTNHSLGMIALNESRSAYVNSIILHKGSPVPGCETRPYRLRTRSDPSGGRRGIAGDPSDGRRGIAGLSDNRLEVYVTQGESESPAEVCYLGKYVLHGFPHLAGGITVIDVEYSYDASGTVEVAGRVRQTGERLAVSVEPLPADVPARFLHPPAEGGGAATHVTAYLAFDLSGSMGFDGGAPLREAQAAAKSFLHHTDLSHASLGVIAFAETVRVELEASQNARKIACAIDRLTVGETGIGNTIHPFDKVRSLLSGVAGPRFVITLTDGVWVCWKQAGEAAGACRADGIQSIAIGFGKANRRFLASIAGSDEASFLTTQSGLVDTFTTIAEVITNWRPEVGVALLPRRHAPELAEPAAGLRRP